MKYLDFIGVAIKIFNYIVLAFFALAFWPIHWSLPWVIWLVIFATTITSIYASLRNIIDIFKEDSEQTKFYSPLIFQAFFLTFLIILATTSSFLSASQDYPGKILNFFPYYLLSISHFCVYWPIEKLTRLWIEKYKRHDWLSRLRARRFIELYCRGYQNNARFVLKRSPQAASAERKKRHARETLSKCLKNIDAPELDFDVFYIDEEFDDNLKVIPVFKKKFLYRGELDDIRLQGHAALLLSLFGIPLLSNIVIKITDEIETDSEYKYKIYYSMESDEQREPHPEQGDDQKFTPIRRRIHEFEYA